MTFTAEPTNDSVYRRTDLGDKAMRGQAGKVPPELIRVLALIAGEAHIDMVKKRAIRMPEGDVISVLDRLVNGGFLDRRAASGDANLDFTAHFEEPAPAAPVLSAQD